MNTLDEAWRWYEDTRLLVKLLKRLADRHWGDLPWDGRLGRDELFGSFVGPDLSAKAASSLDHLDDLAVVVLFSVFESVVRRRVLADVEREGALIRHASLRLAVREATQRVEEGSFFWVLESFKGRDANLVEEVNQVRRYRNWVAHGRRGTPPSSVFPRMAVDRLARFRDVLERESPPIPPGAVAPGESVSRGH